VQLKSYKTYWNGPFLWSLLFTGSLMGGVVQSTVEAFQGRRLMCKDVGGKEGRGTERN